MNFNRSPITPPVVRTSVFVGVSLDGFIAREDGSFDFLGPHSPEDRAYEEFMRTVDAVVMGRKTFETVLSFDEWPYGTRLVMVLSRTLSEAELPPGANCEFTKQSPRGILDDLASRGLKHAYIDGGGTIQSFLREGLIQEIMVSYAPVLIGKGIRLFGDLPEDVRLELRKSTVYPNGRIRNEYRVAPPDGGRPP
jgi:dihydrofolate reductase